MLEEFVQRLDFPDASSVLSPNYSRKLSLELEKAGFELGAGQYFSAALFLSFFAASFLSLAVFSLSSDAWATISSFAILILLLPLFFLFYPSYRKKVRAETIEVELCIALRSLVVELDAGLSFEEALSSMANGGYGELSREIGKVLFETRCGGGSLPQALLHCGERVESHLYKRACMQLSFAYSHGLKGDALRKLADELLSLQKLKGRQFSARMAFLGLLFVSVSCIVPALFAAYAIVGSAFLDLQFSAQDILIAFAVLFPAADALVLLYLREKTPRILSV